MSRRHGNSLRLAALLCLAAIVVWVGIGALHEHPGDPGCQVCKTLHNAAANVVNPTALPAAHALGRTLLVVPDVPNLAVTPATPPGRAPPLT